VVTTSGLFTEPEWSAAGIPLVPAADASALAAAVLDLLDDAPRRRSLVAGEPDFYRRWFSMHRTLTTLLAE
jgi:hypothetical protein